MDFSYSLSILTEAKENLQSQGAENEQQIFKLKSKILSLQSENALIRNEVAELEKLIVTIKNSVEKQQQAQNTEKDGFM